MIYLAKIFNITKENIIYFWMQYKKLFLLFKNCILEIDIFNLEWYSLADNV